MPDFTVLNNIGRKSVRERALSSRLQDTVERKRVHTHSFLRKKFEGYSCYGYMVSSVSRINYTNKEGWKIVEYLLRNNSKPRQQFASYDVFLPKDLSAEAKKLIVNLTGDSSYVYDTAAFFCRRPI